MQSLYGYPNQQGDDLFGFWNILKKQFSEQLSVVTAIFPHYSLHDKSHSEKILDIIWKLFGEDSLKTLSVSNIFAILVVAYAHDLGMSIFSDVLQESLNSTGFIEHVKNIQSNPNNSYHEYASFFEIKEEKGPNDHKVIDAVSDKLGALLTGLFKVSYKGLGKL